MPAPESEPVPKKATELWFRAPALESLLLHNVTATIRMGDRVFGTLDDKGGYEPGETVAIKILKDDGKFEDQAIPVVIGPMVKKKYADLTDADFGGTGENRQNLSKYYGQISPDQDMTIIRFNYPETKS